MKNHKTFYNDLRIFLLRYLVGAKLYKDLFVSFFFIDYLGTIHLRRQQFLGGRGVPFADICQLEEVSGMPKSAIFDFFVKLLH